MKQIKQNFFGRREFHFKVPCLDRINKFMNYHEKTSKKCCSSIGIDLA